MEEEPPLGEEHPVGEADMEEVGDIDLRLPTPTTRYRNTTIGKLLTESLDELFASKKISQELFNKILCQFDRSILNALEHRLTSRVILAFKASKLNTYRYLDGNWTFLLEEVEFREYFSFANVPRLKILAFDGRTPVPRARPAQGKKRWRGGEGQPPLEQGTEGTE